MNESRELSTITDDLQSYAMTPDRVVAQVNLIQQVMARVMHEGEHYGKIPGCGPKPTLLKPGAEKLSTTFRLAPSYDIQKTDMGMGHREYSIVCTLTHIPTGQVFGQGVGSCSTMETKYRYRNSERKCPECGQASILKSKDDSGYFCWQKRGGCGKKFKIGDPAIEDQKMGKEEYPDPADYWNTVLKMAKKRAHVDAILTCVAASDLFTQDVEDLVDNGAIDVGSKSKPVSEIIPKPPTPTVKHQDTSKTDLGTETDLEYGRDDVRWWTAQLEALPTKATALAWAKENAAEIKRYPWHKEFKEQFAAHIAHMEG
jgi:hypothetical protein